MSKVWKNIFCMEVSMKDIRWHFPLVKPNRKDTVADLVEKVRSELTEFEEADNTPDKMLELLDVLHSAETLVRKFFKFYCFKDVDLAADEIVDEAMFEMKQEIVSKNKKRGYYKGD